MGVDVGGESEDVLELVSDARGGGFSAFARGLVGILEGLFWLGVGLGF